jgi:hypothetical protein
MHWAVLGHMPGGDVAPPDTPPPLPPPPPPPPENPTQATPWLPWDMPTDQAWRDVGDALPVAPHYMANWRPAVLDKNVDTDATAYEKKWQPPGALEGTTDHRKYGGYTHNWAIGRDPLGAGYELKDKKWEIRQAKAAGIHHFTVDVLGSDTFKYAQMLAQAAIEEGDFKLVFMLDCGGSIARNGPLNAAAYAEQAFKGLYADAWLKHTDGRFIVMPYSPESVMERTLTLSAALASGVAITALPVKAFAYQQVVAGTVFKLPTTGQLVTTTATVAAGVTSVPIASVTPSAAIAVNGVLAQQDTGAEVIDYWTTFGASMVTRGVPSAVWCLFQRAWQTASQLTAPTFEDTRLDPYVIGYGQWGVSDPVATNAPATILAPATTKNTYGKLYAHTGRSLGDVRPDQSVFSEPGGWEQMLAAFSMILSTDPDFVQWATWNDRREGTEVEVSHMQGWALLDWLSYLTIQRRLGYTPVIARDALYLVHRQQQTPTFTPQPTYTADPTYYTKRMVRFGSTVERNQFDTLVCATAPAQVSLTIAGVAQNLTMGSTTGTSINVPAGVSRVQATLKAAAANTVTATLRRSGATVATVTSPRAVNLTTQLVQTLDHWVTGSLPQTGRPNMTRAGI